MTGNRRRTYGRVSGGGLAVLPFPQAVMNQSDIFLRERKRLSTHGAVVLAVPSSLHDASSRMPGDSFEGVRDLVQNGSWQLGLGADLTFYSKPAPLDPAYPDNPVSFRVFLRLRPGLSQHMH